jgi:hypothetical protein
MGEYVPSAPINDDAKKHNQNLPGMGGVFNYVNLHTYHYAGNNPVKYVDPDGRADWWQIAGGVAQLVSGVIEIGVGAVGEPESFGASTVILIWGTKDALDSVMKIVAGAYDIPYNGAIPETVKAIAITVGADEKGVKLAENIAIAAENAVGIS